MMSIFIVSILSNSYCICLVYSFLYINATLTIKTFKFQKKKKASEFPQHSMNFVTKVMEGAIVQVPQFPFFNFTTSTWRKSISATKKRQYYE